MSKPKKLHLIRDVLDKLLVDRDRIPLGRVDGILMDIGGSHTQPRVVQIECGIMTLAHRVSPRYAQRAQRISRRFGVHCRRPVRVDWSKIEKVGRELTLDIYRQDSLLLATERWLYDQIMRR